MRPKKLHYYACDFETTTYTGQDRTDVWAAGCVELYTEDAHIFHSIEEQFEYFCELNTNIICYYHNLKFDGAFWIDFLLNRSGLRHGITPIKYKDNDNVKYVFDDFKHIEKNSYIYSVTGTGQWYRIIINYKGCLIELRDSLKLLPFTLAEIGKSFKTKHKKLEMEYKGFRYPGCSITDSEKQYLINDLLVLKEALEIFYASGHNKLTIGACCLYEYKRIISSERFNEMFPNLYEIPLNKEKYGASTVGDYIKKSYRGGWCYVVKQKAGRIYKNGFTADVNSLYPSMMHSESGNLYPVFKPFFWQGNYIPIEAQQKNRFFFVRVKTRFYIKHNYLPFIQIKNTLRYGINEMLETSDIIIDGKQHETYIDFDGTEQIATVTLTLTQTDWKLINEHYELIDCEILDGCYFEGMTGIFDEYIERYKKIKLESTGAQRTLAKLFLNNLYGKMAANTISDYKVAFLKEDGSIGFTTYLENEKEPGYIPVGSAITSYARNFTIRAAQANYYGPEKPGFIYADTDSIHCNMPLARAKNLPLHDKNFNAWKIETEWNKAIFVRQKTYIEHAIQPQEEYNSTYDKNVKNPYIIKCAGMTKRAKQLFLKSMGEDINIKNLTAIEEDFLSVKRDLSDFKIGLTVPGLLKPKRIPGGIVLNDSLYVMR